jgi:hypothetical protein
MLFSLAAEQNHEHSFQRPLQFVEVIRLLHADPKTTAASFESSHSQKKTDTVEEYLILIHFALQFLNGRLTQSCMSEFSSDAAKAF